MKGFKGLLKMTPRLQGMCRRLPFWFITSSSFDVKGERKEDGNRERERDDVI